MPIEAVMTLVILIFVLFALIITNRSPDIIMWGGVVLLMVMPVKNNNGWQFGILLPKDALSGFANEGVITIAVLFIVAAGMRETGALQFISHRLLGSPTSILSAQNRIVWPAAMMSAFMNNTPLVAMLLPVINDWAKRNNISVSMLLMPLSYASILGGACTLIGTSSNLIVNGWLINETGHPGLGLFEISKVGIPIAFIGLLYILFTSRWLLKDRKPAISPSEDARQYTVVMIVKPESYLVGKTIKEAGLRGLPSLYLIEIDRKGEALTAVSSNVQLQAEDRLVFAGIVDSVVDLQKFPGLRLAVNQIFKLNEPKLNRLFIEAVVSNSCPLVGKTVRDGKFRTIYNAAIIAVARNGERINKKIGDILLRPGDTLLLEARASFIEQQRNKNDFYLISKVEGSQINNNDRAGLAIVLLFSMIVIITFGFLSMLQAAMLTAGLMIMTKCCSANTARRSIDLETIFVIAAALGLGKAMQISGLAEILGLKLLLLTGDSSVIMLAAVFGLTMLLGNMVTAKAAAVLMLPIVMTISYDAGISVMPFIIAVMLASATALATPIGYPTNLMIYGAGGYRFSDYLLFGIPLSLLIWFLAILLIPIFWPF